MLRYDPRDVAEIRIFHEGRFLCRAICPDLAGETIPLREVLRARNRRRRELRNVLHDRKKAVDALLELKQGNCQGAPPEEPANQPPEREERGEPVLRRYINE